MKTSELTGVALDWAVAKCIGHLVAENHGEYIRIHLPNTKQSGHTLAFCPSTDWALGGEIIEREGICLWCGDGAWEATIHSEDEPVTQRGNTPLIAAMRCYVASKLGDEVDIPTELTQGASK